MEYKVARTEVINPDINSPEWENAEVGYVDKDCWDGWHKGPKTIFKILRGPEGMSVLFHTDETNLRSEVTEENGAVCNDSCMELFFQPYPWDPNYLNFEVNPKGVLHLGIGIDRCGRTLITEDRKTFDIVSIANEGDWTLKYYIPDSFLKKWYPDVDKKALDNSETVSKANVYKCGEATGHSHFTVWSEVDTKCPDFHQPKFFGIFRF
ncbi:MAG: carbohydrate-binding family 9-like protein [Clostridia bacterium]|nr:carbohydrate-binding family 9-like protein [Clostridia bacterium]